jgi:hypothetical protein
MRLRRDLVLVLFSTARDWRLTQYRYTDPLFSPTIQHGISGLVQKVTHPEQDKDHRLALATPRNIRGHRPTTIILHGEKFSREVLEEVRMTLCKDIRREPVG